MVSRVRPEVATNAWLHVMQMVVALRAQYRMAADIMLLANTIVYDGQLRCGADLVAEAVLDLQVAPSQTGHPQWLNQVSF